MYGSYADSEIQDSRRREDALRAEVRELSSKNFHLQMQVDGVEFRKKMNAVFAVFFLATFALVAVCIAVKSGEPRLIAIALAEIPALVVLPAVLMFWGS